MRQRRLALPFTLVFAAVAAVPSAAQVQLPASEILTARPYQSQPIPDRNLTLDDAVRLTLRNSPRILAAAERVRLAEGRFQETRGLFDSSFRIAPSATFTLHEVTPSLRFREKLKRDAILGVRDSFLQTGDAYRSLLKGDLATIPTCPALFGRSGLGVGGSAINLDLADPTEVALSGVDRSVSAFNVDLGGGLDTITIERICRSQPRQQFSAEAFAGVWRDTIRVIDFTGGRGLEGALISASQVPREMFTVIEEIARTVAQRAEIALGRLGPIERDEFKRNLQIDATFTKPLRSGATIRADYQIQSQEHNFVGKPLDPAFGGLDVPPMFFNGVSGTLRQPLGRGRGAKAAASTERAAEMFAAGEREQLRHAASAEVLRTLLAYLNLVAAQERVGLLEESRTRLAEILRLTEQRVAAGDIAAIENERVRAHEAGVTSALSQGQADLLSARLSLAEAMGVDVSGPDTAPVATDSFAQGLSTLPPDIEALFTQARALRRDTRAAAARQRAATALVDAARTQTRPLMDLELTFGMSNLYESPFFRYLPDEQDAIIDARARVVTPTTSGTPVPPLSPVRYWDLRGYSRALTGRYEPYFRVGFTFELPFGNNRAKGRVAQAQAGLSSATVDVINLSRVVEQNLVDMKESVEHAARALAHWESAVADSTRTFESQQRLLQAGTVTLVDLLLTEEGLASDQQRLMLQRQLYLSALGRLKFDLGELVGFEAAGTAGELLRFLSAGFTGR